MKEWVLRGEDDWVVSSKQASRYIDGRRSSRGSSSSSSSIAAVQAGGAVLDRLQAAG
jgi:hypothetical protein